MLYNNKYPLAFLILLITLLLFSCKHDDHHGFSLVSEPQINTPTSTQKNKKQQTKKHKQQHTPYAPSNPAKLIFFKKNNHPIIHISLGADEKGEILLTNTGDQAVKTLKLIINPELKHTFKGGSCFTTKTLAPKASCTIVYEGEIKTQEATGKITATDEGDKGVTQSLSVTVFSAGHLVFRQNNKDLQQLSLNPNSQGELTVVNTGESTIRNFKLTIDKRLGRIIRGDECTKITTLPPHASCRILFNVEDKSKSVISDISLTGSGADTKVTTLPIIVLTPGHLVFSQQKTPINDLTLHPRDKGEIIVTNKRGSTITDIKLLIDDPLKGIITHETCTKKSQLSIDENCSIFYKVDPLPQGGSGKITVLDQGADTSAVELPIRVLRAGHLTLKEQGQPLPSPLVLHPKAQGNIDVINTGETSVTDLKLLIEKPLSVIFNPGKIANTPTLTPNESSFFSYKVNTNSHAINSKVTLSGKGADNNIIEIPVKVLSTGHLSFRQNDREIKNITLEPNTKGQITLINSGQTPVTKLSTTIENSLRNIFTSNTCTKIQTLLPGNKCTFSYSVEKTATRASGKISITGDDVDNTPLALSIRVLSAGHLTFQRSGKDITRLDLKPESSDTITVINTGETDVTDISVSIPTQLSSAIVDNNCASKGQLTPNDSCTLTYTVGNTPASASGKISITSKHADVSPVELPIKVFSAGHLAFQRGGKDIARLDLKPESSDTITVVNTGETDVTDISVSIPTPLSNRIVDNNCASKRKLPPNDSCTLTYTVGNTPASASGKISITSKHADASPVELPIKVFSAGHLTLKQQDSTSTTPPSAPTSSLSFYPNRMGKIIITNTGEMPVTNITIKIDDAIKAYIQDNGCDGLASLDPNKSCTITYKIGAQPTSFTSKLEINSKGADDNAIELPLTVFRPGHLAFKQKGSDISSLVLKPTEVGDITISNSGETPVTDFTLNIDSALNPVVNGGSCASTTTLAPNASCTVSYTINSKPSKVNGSITASGNDADKSPVNLNITVVGPGHLVFKAFGAEVNHLAMITNYGTGGKLENTGDVEVTGINLKLRQAGGMDVPIINDLGNNRDYESVSTWGNCLTASSLKPGETCVLSFMDDSRNKKSPPTGLEMIVTSQGSDNSPFIFPLYRAGLRAFITSSRGNKILMCPVTSPHDNTSQPVPETISDCVDTGISGLNSPGHIIFNGAGTRSYITNSGSNTIIKCAINQANGLLDDCKDTGASSLKNPSHIALSADERYAYITNSTSSSDSDNKIVKCNVNPSDGSFSNCQQTGASINQPSGISFNADYRYAYVTSMKDETIYRYAVNRLTGEFSGKTDLQSTSYLERPLGITLNKAGTLAWVASASKFSGKDVHYVSLFRMTPLQHLVSDDNAESGADKVSSPSNILVNTAGTRAFITDLTAKEGHHVTQCKVDPITGKMSDCKDSNASGLNEPTSLVISSAPYTRIFILNAQTLTQCILNTANNEISSCENNALGGISDPQSLAFHPTAFPVYIVHKNSDKISRCIIPQDNEGAAITNCLDSGATNMNDPVRIIFNTLGSHAFIINQGNHSVTVCKVNAQSGNLFDCEEAGPGTPKLNEQLNRPSSLAMGFKSVFITSRGNNKVVGCSLNYFDAYIFACSDSQATEISDPSDILLNRNRTKAFILNQQNSSITVCDVNDDRQILSNCQNAGASELDSPSRMSFSCGNDRIFVSNSNNDSVTQCKLDQSSGKLSNCEKTKARGLDNPSDIHIFPTTTIWWGYDPR